MGDRPVHPASAQRRPDGKQQRGVWFAWADILAIGEMLPDLMMKRQAMRAATVNADPGGAPTPAAPADHQRPGHQ